MYNHDGLLQDMVEEFPDYLDGYLRLACIERKRGNLKKAIHWAEQGIDKAEASSKGSPSHTDLLAMAGQPPLLTPPAIPYRWSCTPVQ